MTGPAHEREALVLACEYEPAWLLFRSDVEGWQWLRMLQCVVVVVVVVVVWLLWFIELHLPRTVRTFLGLYVCVCVAVVVRANSPVGL
jgi:hypothetical protein